jgi:N-acetylmuramoyl-L-alanine amidase
MGKYRWLIYIAIIYMVFLFGGTAGTAAGNTSSDGSMELSLKVNGEAVKADVPPMILENRTMVPARALFEKLGANVVWDNSSGKVKVSLNGITIELKINSNMALVNNKNVELDVSPKIINDRTLLPVRFISEQLNMKVGWLENEKLVTVDSVKLGDITCTKTQDISTVTVNLDFYKNYSVFVLKEPYRVVIDLPNIKAPEQPQKKTVDSGIIKSIRFAQFEKTNARIVLDVVKKPYYSIEENDDKLIINVSGEAGSVSALPSSKSADISSPTPTPISIPEGSSNSLYLVYKRLDLQDTVEIETPDYRNYKLFRATNPDRIVVEIPGLVPEKEQNLKIDSDIIKSISSGRSDSSSARIEVLVNGYPDYSIEEKSGRLLLCLKNPTYKDISYVNKDGRVFFTLSGLNVLHESGDKLYSESVEANGLKYTITFPANLADPGKGIFKINDEYIEYAEITDNESDGTKSVVLYARQAFEYKVSTWYEKSTGLADTTITLLKQGSYEDKLVIIDPGHGGSDPGVVANGINEKDVNLDVALRLNELLKKNGVKTFMTRYDDSYVGLSERAAIANKLNASLFLSIHHNSFTSQAKGTETYYHNKVSGKKLYSETFAEIIQESLLKALNTYDRKVKTANYAVIRETQMPSVLTEIAFISSPEDAKRIKSEEFRQKAAEALCSAILMALQNMQD